MRVVLDSATLPADQATQLARLVQEIDLTRMGAEIGAASDADLTRYRLAVEYEGRHWRGTVAEPCVPAALRPLLRFLLGAGAGPQTPERDRRQPTRTG